MATKNLSRTVIEGGRTSRNKMYRYASNRTYRANNRRFSYWAKNLVDPDELGPSPERRTLAREQSDKLGPMYRWLHKKIGKKWDQTFSELVHQFDRRTIAGNHVVKDHLLGSITLQVTDARHYLSESWGFREFFVDEEGILQQGNPRPKPRPSYGRPHWDAKVQNWAANRMVMDYGVSIFWMVPETIDWVRCGYRTGYYLNNKPHWSTSNTCHRRHRYVPGLVRVAIPDFDVPRMPSAMREKIIKKVEFNWDGTPSEVLYLEEEVRECKQGLGHYFQGPRFSDSDIAMWNTLDGREKYDLLWVKREEYLKR